MGLKTWLTALPISAIFTFGAAPEVTAQDVEQRLRSDTTETSASQEVDYSKVKIDSVQIMHNGQPLSPAVQKNLKAGKEFDDAQDAYDLNNTLQRRLEEQDPTLMRLLQADGNRTTYRFETATTTHAISVDAYDGEEKKFTFDADDVTKDATIDATTPEDSTRTRTRRRGGGEEQEGRTRTRTRSRGGNSGEQQMPEPD